MVPLIMNGVLLVLGLLMLHEIRIAMMSIRALRWRLTEGHLENWSNRSELTTETLRYSYVVEGESFQSEQLGYGYPVDALQIIASKELTTVLEKAPEVVVYYDPRKPDVSVLLNGFKVFHALRMLLILLFFGSVWAAVWVLGS